MANMENTITPASNTRFARLMPADRPAHLAFHRIAEKVKADPSWNQHARKYMVIYDKKVDIVDVTSESESEGGSGPQAQKRSIWWGHYELNFNVPPRDPRQGWIIGGGRFGPNDDSPELVLTERKMQDCIRGRHARLYHSYSSGALLLRLASDSMAVVDGKDLQDSIVIWSNETRVAFGTMNYAIQLDGAVESIHRARLNRYHQTHNLGMNEFPFNLLSTPAPSDYIHKDYIVKNPVAHGCFSTVFAAVHLKTSAVVAIKRTTRHHGNAGQIQREIEMAACLGRHHRLCQLVDKMSPDGDRRSETFRTNLLDEVYLVYSPLVLTTWVTVLCAEGPSTESHSPVCTTLFWQCLEGIEYIHSKGVMHRDINPNNLAIISFNPPQSRVTDFGNAITTNTSNDTQVGKLQYRAPEMWRIFRSGEAGLEAYDKKVDLFAFGVSAYQLFCKRPTWWDGEADVGAVGYMKDEIRAQKGASPHVKKLIRSMLIDDADLRPNAQQMRLAPDTSTVQGNQG